MEEKKITRAKAIRLKCLDCCCGSNAEVRNCPVKNCPLWRYRMGSEKRAYAAFFESNDLEIKVYHPDKKKPKTPS